MLLDTAPQQLSLQQNEYALPFNYLWGPQGKPISDPAFQGAALQLKGIGLRPLSPVQLSAVWRGGDLALSWIRRTRIGGDSWDQTDVPLGEEEESYDIEILDASGNAIRTFAACHAIAHLSRGKHRRAIFLRLADTIPLPRVPALHHLRRGAVARGEINFN